MNKQIALVALGIAVLFGVGSVFKQPAAQEVRNFAEHWPPHVVKPEWLALAKTYAETGKGRGYVKDFKGYTSDGPYLGFAANRYEPGERIQIDGAGLPLVKYGKAFKYNPVTISQFALASYSRGDIEHFLAASDKLLTLQSNDGAFRYQFNYTHYTSTQAYAVGWISGLAQGHALSVYARAYAKTGEQKYLDAGNKALAAIQFKFPNGPMTTMADLDPSLSGYIFFLEYPTKPNVYTLNGYMFALLGLHDWAELAHSERAGHLFSEGVRTLKKVLPYYDIGAFTAYDLSYLTHRMPYLRSRAPYINPAYHHHHINLTMAIGSITGDPFFTKTADRWKSYVDPKK